MPARAASAARIAPVRPGCLALAEQAKAALDHPARRSAKSSPMRSGGPVTSLVIAAMMAVIRSRARSGGMAGQHRAGGLSATGTRPLRSPRPSPCAKASGDRSPGQACPAACLSLQNASLSATASASRLASAAAGAAPSAPGLGVYETEALFDGQKPLICPVKAAVHACKPFLNVGQAHFLTSCKSFSIRSVDARMWRSISKVWLASSSVMESMITQIFQFPLKLNWGFS
jgi:hypothetical protein